MTEQTKNLSEERAYVPQYDCCQEMFDNLHESMHISDIGQMNFWMDNFTRLICKRHLTTTQDSFNTGLLDWTGKYMHIAIPNIKAKRRDWTPELIETESPFLKPLCFYKNRIYLTIQQELNVEVNRDNVLQVLKKHALRLAPVARTYSEEQLLQYINMSIELAREMLKVNPMWAFPLWYAQTDYIAHMLPLYDSEDMRNDSIIGVLVIAGKNVRTIYSIEMAREFTCLYQIPIPAWLEV